MKVLKQELNKEFFLACVMSGTFGAMIGNALQDLSGKHFIWIGMGIIGVGFIYQWIKGDL